MRKQNMPSFEMQPTSENRKRFATSEESIKEAKKRAMGEIRSENFDLDKIETLFDEIEGHKEKIAEYKKQDEDEAREINGEFKNMMTSTDTAKPKAVEEKIDGTKTEKTESPLNTSFEKMPGYYLEIFDSKEKMHLRMEQIRQENSNEAHGFVESNNGKIGFYYRIGENKTSVEFDHHADNSWHSHPDIAKDEIIFDDKLPDDVSEDVKRAMEEFLMICDEIDEPSPNKLSITDILTFISGERKKDLISIPGGLLEINSFKSLQNGLLKEYATELKSYGEKLFSEENEISLHSLYKNQIFHLKYSALKFKSLLEKLGYTKMTDENSFKILKEMGFDFEFHKV